MNLIPILRRSLVQDRLNPECRAVPAWHRATVGIGDVPEDVRASILSESPRTTTVHVGLHTRKGAEYVTYFAGEGSPDGFPHVVQSL